MRLLLLVLAALCFPAPSASAAPLAVPPRAVQDKSIHEDARYGFKFRAPKAWTRIPLKLEEQWQVAKYLSDRSYFYTDPDGGWTNEHKPETRVIAFVSEKVREEAKLKKEQKKDQDGRYVILIQNPYKDYLDYMKQTYSGGGWFVSDQKETKIEDVDVTQYEIKVEKLTRDGPKRIICWVYHTPEVDFAFHWEVLESSFPKLKDTIFDALKSFRLIPRTEAGLPTAATGGNGVVLLDDMEKLTPVQRKERRVGLEKSLHAKAKESLSPGWQVLQVGRFLVLNHTDEKYARRVAEHSEAIFNWLDETFPFVGPDEYVRAPILRICKDSDEEMSFRSGGGYWFSDNQIEIVISQDNEGFVTGWAVERVNRQLLELWFSERDRDMSFAMPYWLEHGLDQVIGTARAKAKKVEFRVDDWERDGIRERLREGTFTRPRDLIKMGAEEYTSSSESFFGRAKEAGGLVRFLATGPAAKSPKTRDVLRDYMKNLRLTINEIEAEEKAKGKGETKAPKTEKEEEEQFKASAESWKKKEKRLLDATFERCFHGWSDKDWDAFEATYVKSVS